MKEKQLSILDFGLMDAFDCSRCIWKKHYGYCYPKEKIGRQYYYESERGRECSDYSKQFASIKRK